MNDLTVGTTVHYTDNPVHGGGHARCFEATVTAVNPDGTIDIDEHLPGETTPAYSLELGKPGDLYTWHCCHRLDPHEHTPEGGTNAVRPTEGERETNRLLHYITGGAFL